MESNKLEDIKLDERSYLFFPTREQQKIGFGKEKGTRVVFHGQVEHDDFEKKKIEEFKSYVKGKKLNYDSDFYNDHMLVLFLSSYSYKNDQTFEAMKQHLQFRAKYVFDPKGDLIIQYSNDDLVRKLVNDGFFYICGRDLHFRPTIVFNLPRTSLKDSNAVLRAVVFVQEQAIAKLMIPGQVESWNIIYDIGGMGITDLPVNSLKSTLQTISQNYNGRLYKLWMVNAPGTIYFSWKVVKNFLHAVTVDKITIAKKNTDDSLWKHYDKSQIEVKYGGTMPDKTVFYPFQIPQAVVDEKRLISHEKYDEMYKKGLLKNNAIHPKLQTSNTKENNELKVQQNLEQKHKEQSGFDSKAQRVESAEIVNDQKTQKLQTKQTTKEDSQPRTQVSVQNS